MADAQITQTWRKDKHGIEFEQFNHKFNPNCDLEGKNDKHRMFE